MLKKFVKRNWQLFLFNFIFLLIFILGYGRFGDVIVDSFREPYIASQILKGEVLYKNVFMIYPPLSYFINAFLFIIFGTKLKVVYMAGFLAAGGIINLVYKIASKFMSKTVSLSIVLFIIAGSCLSPNVFNLFFPYSFGILYGILFMLGAFYCALYKKYPAAYFLYSLAICAKYEFILVLPVLVWISWNKNVIKNIIAFFVPLIITALIMGLHGIRWEDLVISGQFILSMSSSKTLYWFYSVVGLVYRPQLIPIYISNFLKYFIPFCLICYFKNIWVYILLVFYLYFIVNPEILIYAYPLILVMLFIRYKHLSREKLFWVLSSLLVSAKLFFALTLKSYGVYFLPFALISLFILIPPKYRKSLSIITISASLILAVQNINTLFQKHVRIKTNKGIVYATTYNGVGINALISYIDKYVDKNDKMVILPECLSVNFLTGINSDNKFYSLIPLYVEVFGEDLIINRLKRIQPKYIVITNYDTSNYYYSYFGQDYAGDILNYIIKNYTLETKFGQGLLFNVYKLKD